METKRNAFLDELSALANNKDRQIEMEEELRDEKEKNRQKQRAAFALANLKERLLEAARRGARKLVIFKSEYTDFHEDLRKKIRPYGNTYCAIRDKGITYDDVRENAMGAFREVFQELQKEGFEPQIKYCNDGGGIEEWYEIYIQWQ